MLTALELENFKGIAARQRVEFAPLTLLFGSNSAGKSTILQALLYLHELLERGSADVDRTQLGGSVLELGGFARLVHRHEIERPIILKAEFATPGGLERFGRDLGTFPFPDLDDEIETAWLEVTIRYIASSTFHGPIVERAVVGVNGLPDPLVSLEIGTTLREGEPLHAVVNLDHPLLLTNTVEGAGYLVDELWGSVAIAHEVLDGRPEREANASGGGSKEGSGPPGQVEPRRPVFALARTRLSVLPVSGEPLRVIPFGDESPEKSEAAAQVRTFLEMVVLGTTSQLLAFLQDGIYIGPLRMIPPRGFLYERVGRVTSWADGLAAWDLLLGDRLTLVERTNYWLRRLGAGCQVVVQQLFDRGSTAEELSEGHVDKTVRRLHLDTGGGSLVLPSEVGAGVSQVVPVVVAALEGSFGLTMVEQPEIHVHPAVQVGLGDLFIDAVVRDGGRRIFLVETHSEHLILRVLRRIRETAEGTLTEEAPSFSNDKLSVTYVEAAPDGVRFRRLRVDETGDFQDRWPTGFFAERMPELL